MLVGRGTPDEAGAVLARTPRQAVIRMENPPNTSTSKREVKTGDNAQPVPLSRKGDAAVCGWNFDEDL